METNDTLNPDTQPLDAAAEIAQLPDTEPVATDAQPDAELDQPEVVETEPRSSPRWIGLVPTALFGILMFVLGGVGGFVGRPYILVPTPTLTAAQQQQAKMQGILDMLVSKTRHFKGSANAPVTLLEFSDFQ